MTRMLAAALCLSALFVSQPAGAADYTRGSGEPSACASRTILDIITARFNATAPTYLKSDVAIADIRRPGQTRLERRDATHRIPREYCHATAVTTDGQTRTLWYLIERDMGFAGAGSNIAFCVNGLDPWFVHGAQCASLR